MKEKGKGTSVMAGEDTPDKRNENPKGRTSEKKGVAVSGYLNHRKRRKNPQEKKARAQQKGRKMIPCLSTAPKESL